MDSADRAPREPKRPLAWPLLKQLANRCKLECNVPKDAYSPETCVVDCWVRHPKLKHEHHSSSENRYRWDRLSFPWDRPRHFTTSSWRDTTGRLRVTRRVFP